MWDRRRSLCCPEVILTHLCGLYWRLAGPPLRAALRRLQRQTSPPHPTIQAEQDQNEGQTRRTMTESLRILLWHKLIFSDSVFFVYLNRSKMENLWIICIKKPNLIILLMLQWTPFLLWPTFNRLIRSCALLQRCTLEMLKDILEKAPRKFPATLRSERPKAVEQLRQRSLGIVSKISPRFSGGGVESQTGGTSKTRWRVSLRHILCYYSLEPLTRVWHGNGLQGHLNGDSVPERHIRSWQQRERQAVPPSTTLWRFNGGMVVVQSSSKDLRDILS